MKPESKIGAIGWAALNAAGAVLYVLLVVTLIQYGLQDGPEGPLGFAAFLLLFCLSAAIMASLVFGRPMMWYLDGMKKEALALTMYTLLFLFIATVIFLLPTLIGSDPVFRVEPL